MIISRDLAIKILKYCNENKNFYFPFFIMCKEYSPEDDDFVEIEYEEWEDIKNDDLYQTFELWENLKNLSDDTVELLSKGFVEKITQNYLENDIEKLKKYYKTQWNNQFLKNKKNQGFQLNEFVNGKVNAFDDCLYLIKMHQKIKLK